MTAPAKPRPTTRESLRAWAMVLVLIAGLGLAMLAIWALKSQGNAGPAPATGTIRSLSSPGQAIASLKIALADGRELNLHADSRLLARCRVGGSIRVTGTAPESGASRWTIALNPCD